MDPITIDPNLCSGCGICTRLCPYGIPTLNDADETATVNPVTAPYCSRCGHCEAVCPERAITTTYPGAVPAPGIAGEAITPGQIAALMMMRRSIRDYKEKTVPRETLEEIFDIIRYAPTGMNGQSVHWLVIQDPAEVHRLSGRVIDWARDMMKTRPDSPLAPVFPLLIRAWENGIDPICHRAPHLVIAHGRRDQPLGFIDAIIALTHLDLAAPVFGLGTCWAGFMQIALDTSPAITAELNLPEGHKPHYAMMLGYPEYRFHRAPKRDAAKVTWRE
jgi:nitroreductase/NAD-dependent dihydropyrimidine dehydrogenase PreA subunit